jgi:hypothetical protein
LRGALITLEKHEAVLEPLNSANQEHKHLDLGNAVVATLAATTHASFEEVTVLEQCAPNTVATGDLQAIVIAQLPDARVALFRGWNPRWASYGGARICRPASYATFGRWQTVPDMAGFWERECRTRLLSWEYYVVVTFSAALLNASARLLADLSLKPLVLAWFASIGAHGEPAEALPIAGSAQNGLPEDMAISTNGKIAILSNGSNKEFGRHTAQCLSKALESLDGGARILEEDRARDAFFPWLEYDVLSTHSGEAVLVSQLLRSVLDKPASILSSLPPMPAAAAKGRDFSSVTQEAEAQPVGEPPRCSEFRLPRKSGIFGGWRAWSLTGGARSDVLITVLPI